LLNPVFRVNWLMRGVTRCFRWSSILTTTAMDVHTTGAMALTPTGADAAEYALPDLGPASSNSSILSLLREGRLA
jgi:hypothetical protein